MLPKDGEAGSVTVTATDVVLTGYALPAAAAKLIVCVDCQVRLEPPEPATVAETQRHVEVATLHTKPTSRRLVETVDVGRVTVDDEKDAPHVIAMAVVPVIAIQSFWPLTGVPVRFVVNEVMATD